jgi:hypothetical protein
LALAATLLSARAEGSFATKRRRQPSRFPVDPEQLLCSADAPRRSVQSEDNPDPSHCRS